MSIVGAETGDKYKLTAILEGYGLTKDVNITVGSDTQARFPYKNPNTDKNFRTAPFPADENRNTGLGMSR